MFVYTCFCFCLEALSEDDLLSQYSSFTKKTKKNSCGDNAAFSSSEMSAPILDDGTAHKTDAYTPSRTRNKFAVFLRRKNEKSGAVVVPGTRSRYHVPRVPFKLGVALFAEACCMLVFLVALCLSYFTVAVKKVPGRRKSNLMKERFVLGHIPKVQSSMRVERCQGQETPGQSHGTQSERGRLTDKALSPLYSVQDASVSHLLQPTQRILTGVSRGCFPG